MTFLNIAVNDFKIIIKDKKALIILLLMPFVLISILGMVFKNVGTVGINSFEIAVLSEDKGAVVQETDEFINMGELLTEYVLKGKAAEDVFKVINVNSYEEGLDLVKRSRAAAFVYVPANFSKDYLDQKKVSLEVRGDPKKIYTPQIVKGFVGSFTDRLNSVFFARTEMAEMEVQYDIKMTDEENSSSLAMWGEMDKLNVNLVSQGIRNRKSVPGIAYYGITMAIMFALFSGQEGALRMLEEKRNMTAARIFISPISHFMYLTGKLLGIIILVLSQMFVLLFGAAVAFGVDWGSWVAIFTMTFSVAFCIGAIALSIGSSVSTNDAALKVYNLCIWLFSFLSGTFVPRNILPPFIQRIGAYTPNGQAISGYLKIIQGDTVSHWFHHWAILIGLGIIFLVLALATSNNEKRA